SRTYPIAPIRAGSSARRLCGTSSTTGRAKDALTAVYASAELMPPTSTPEIVTPSAIASGVVVVVPVVVVAATTPPARPPAASSPSTNRSARPAFLIPRGSLARFLPLNPRLPAVSTKPAAALGRRPGWTPGQGRGWPLAPRDSGRQTGAQREDAGRSSQNAR